MLWNLHTNLEEIFAHMYACIVHVHSLVGQNFQPQRGARSKHGLKMRHKSAQDKGGNTSEAPYCRTQIAIDICLLAVLPNLSRSEVKETVTEDMSSCLLVVRRAADVVLQRRIRHTVLGSRMVSSRAFFKSHLIIMARLFL